MTYVREEAYCSVCKKFGTIRLNSYQCLNCEVNVKKQKRKEHYKYLDTLTQEERIRKIERWIYNYKPEHVPAPRFGM